MFRRAGFGLPQTPKITWETWDPGRILPHDLQPLSRRSLAPGTEYTLHDAQEPHLFVIRKQHRPSAAAVDSPPHAFYYILDGSVYQVNNMQFACTCHECFAGPHRDQTCVLHSRRSVIFMPAALRGLPGLPQLGGEVADTLFDHLPHSHVPRVLAQPGADAARGHQQPDGPVPARHAGGARQDAARPGPPHVRCACKLRRDPNLVNVPQEPVVLPH